MSPRHQRSARPASSMSASTAWSAGRFPWTSLRIARRTWRSPSLGSSRPGSRAAYRMAMRRPSSLVRVGLAAVAAVAVAELAVWLLRPRYERPDPVPVNAQNYFPPAELQRIDDFSGPQRTL